MMKVSRVSHETECGLADPAGRQYAPRGPAPPVRVLSGECELVSVIRARAGASQRESRAIREARRSCWL